MEKTVSICDSKIYVTIKWQRRFVKFLLEKGIYLTYLENIKNSFLREEYYSKITIENPRNFIMDAFVWDYTPEGEKYWNDIHHEWVGKYKNL